MISFSFSVSHLDCYRLENEEDFQILDLEKKFREGLFVILCLLFEGYHLKEELISSKKKKCHSLKKMKKEKRNFLFVFLFFHFNFLNFVL